MAANATAGLHGDFGRRSTPLVRVLRQANWSIRQGPMPGPEDRT